MPDSTLWKKKKKVQHFNNNRPYKCFNWLALQKNYNLPTLSSNFGHPKQQSKHIHVQFIYDHWTHGTWIRRYTVSPSPSSPPTKKKKHKTEKKNQHTTVFTKCLWTCDFNFQLIAIFCCSHACATSYHQPLLSNDKNSHKKNTTDMSRCPVQSHSKQKQIPHDVVVLAFTFLWRWKGPRP